MGGGVDCLFAVDSGTTGADTESKWLGLTKGNGYSAKNEADAAGSYGLGSFAPFAATDLRVVLYGTAYGQENNLRRKFMGKAILASHVDRSGISRRSTGYLAVGGFEAAQDQAVPAPFSLDEPGVCLCIPGYTGSGEDPDWEEQYTVHVIRHFFPALTYYKLRVQVGERQIEKKDLPSLRRVLDKDRREDAALLRFLDVAGRHPEYQRKFDGIGLVKIRVDTTPQGLDGASYRDIALTRDAGMITLWGRSKFREAFSFRSVPRSWHNFTALIEVISYGMGGSYLRKVESPAHDHISVDRISDPQERKKVKAALQAMGAWIWEKLEEKCAPQQNQDDMPVDALQSFLGLVDDLGADDNTEHKANWQQEDLFTRTPYQSEKVLKDVAVPTTTNGDTQTPGDENDEEETSTEVVDPPGENGERNGHPKKKRKEKKEKTVSSVTAREIFAQLRLRPGPSSTTHILVASFNRPDHPISGIGLSKLTDDGSEVTVGFNKVFVNGDEYPVVDNSVEVASWPCGKRVGITFHTNEPVGHKTFCLVLKKKRDL